MASLCSVNAVANAIPREGTFMVAQCNLDGGAAGVKWTGQIPGLWWQGP